MNGEKNNYMQFIESDSDLEEESAVDLESSANPQSNTCDKLRNILKEKQQFENLKARRNQFGFENVRDSVVSAGGSGTNKSKITASVKKGKRPNTSIENAASGQPPKKCSKKSNNGQTSSSSPSIPVSAAAAAAATATAATSFSTERENDIVNVDDDDENGERDSVSVSNGQRKMPSDPVEWKLHKVSKSQHLRVYFEFKTPDANKKMKAKCKLCGNTVCGTSGNNSNFLSHLRYVSIVFTTM